MCVYHLTVRYFGFNVNVEVLRSSEIGIVRSFMENGGNIFSTSIRMSTVQEILN